MAELSQQDRNLATALVLGTLRWKLALDAELTGLLARPDVRLSNAVATTLELGAFQLRHMDRIPVHAAIDESVELVRAAGQSHATGMVNAILRKLAGQPAPSAKVFETPAQFAERLGHPDWLVERWAKAYGPAAAKAICEYGQREPGGAAAEPESVAADAPPAEPIPGEALVAEVPIVVVPVTEAPTIEVPTPDAAAESLAVAAPPSSGFEIDPGSRLVAELAAALAPERAVPLSLWDTCAAPGGKTLVLAQQLLDATILATDASPRRLKAMAERLERDGLAGNGLVGNGTAARIRTEVADAAALPAEHGDFDLILCDAPCSGTGTLARNPEIRLRLEPAELSRQAKRQRELLRAALGRLKPGGRLVYSTCSLEPEENEDVVAWVLQRVPGVQRVALYTYVARLVGEQQASALVRQGCLRTLPGANFAGDGFFAAAFERAS